MQRSGAGKRRKKRRRDRFVLGVLKEEKLKKATVP
jgi:hypothetical protein